MTCAGAPVITERWQLLVLMRVPGYKDNISVTLKPGTGAEEVLQIAMSALHRLPSTEQVMQWSDKECSNYLLKYSPLWAEVGPVVFAFSTYVLRAAKILWEGLTDTSYEDPADRDESLWVVLDKHKKANSAFSKCYVMEVLYCVQDVRHAVTPNSWN